jgi:hypothetical protein
LEAGHVDVTRFFEYPWSSIASIISVPIGSFSKGMKFLVRIAYNLSMPFGMAASRFKSSRRSSLVFMIAVMSTPWVFTGDLVSVEVRADPEGRTSTLAYNLCHERHQDRKSTGLDRTRRTPASDGALVVVAESKAVTRATTTVG